MKRIFFIAILLISLVIINNLVRSIYSLWQKKDLIIKAQIAVEKEKKENQQLKKQLQEVSKPGFVEEEARDKLFMGKPGEQVVLLPTTTPLPKETQKEEAKSQAHWLQWWQLFFRQ